MAEVAQTRGSPQIPETDPAKRTGSGYGRPPSVKVVRVSAGLRSGAGQESVPMRSVDHLLFGGFGIGDTPHLDEAMDSTVHMVLFQ